MAVMAMGGGIRFTHSTKSPNSGKIMLELQPEQLLDVQDLQQWISAQANARYFRKEQRKRYQDVRGLYCG
jgi:hypothetical protein